MVPPVGTQEVNDASLSTFEQAICATHGADQAVYTGRSAVRETFEDETVWVGEVLSFILQGHPTAKRCYAWEVDGEITAVLHEGTVDSPEAAVRAAIVAQGPEPAEA